MYVALTRAKKEAMLSFAELRRVWGKTENTLPSRFLREIEAEYLDPNFRLEELNGRSRFMTAGIEDDDDDDYTSYDPRRSRSTEGRAAAQRPYGQGAQRSYGQPQQRGTFERRAQSTPSPRPATHVAPRPELVTTPPPVDPRRAGMRSVGVRQSETDAAVQTNVAVGACPYAVGDRVEHPKFGRGVVERIEMLATDHKIVVAFTNYGSKTLLANFAKLTKL